MRISVRKRGNPKLQREAAFMPALHFPVCNKLTIMELFSPISIPYTSDDSYLIGRAALYCSLVSISSLISYITMTSLPAEHIETATSRIQRPEALEMPEADNRSALVSRKKSLNLPLDSTMHWKISISLLMGTTSCDQLSLLPSQSYQIKLFLFWNTFVQ